MTKATQDLIAWLSDAAWICRHLQPGFYATLADWYCKGHFPCGWSGEHPDGKLVVF